MCEIFDAMKADCGAPPSRLLVDGGMTQSELLLQLQANLLGVDVHKPDIKEVRSQITTDGAHCTNIYVNVDDLLR